MRVDERMEFTILKDKLKSEVPYTLSWRSNLLAYKKDTAAYFYLSHLHKLPTSTPHTIPITAVKLVSFLVILGVGTPL